MTLKFEGISLDSTTDVKYNGTSLDYLKLNGTVVWEKEAYTTIPFLAYGSQSSTGSYNNTAFVSSNLSSWTQDANQYTVAYNYGGQANGWHLSVLTEDNTNYLVVTKGGITWRKLNCPRTVFDTPNNKILYQNGIYLICNYYYAYKTTDLRNLTALTPPDNQEHFGSQLNFSTINGYFYFWRSGNPGSVYQSADLENWTALGSTVNCLPSAYYNGYYYGLRASSSSSVSKVIRKFSSDFSTGSDLFAGTRYPYMTTFTTMVDHFYFTNYTQNQATQYVSCIDPTDDSLIDFYSTSSSYVEQNNMYYYPGWGVFCYNGTNMIRIAGWVPNQYILITNPYQYYLKKIIHFAK